MIMKNLTDVEIIESVKKGNQADFSILIDRYKNKAFTMLINLNQSFQHGFIG